MEIMNLWYVVSPLALPFARLTTSSIHSVLHLSEIERDTGEGVDRDELIEWYLEQKEHEFAGVQDLENEREIIGKALTKLAKVS